MQVAIHTGDRKAAISWGATGVARVLQNINNLISLSRYEVAYNRTLGLSPELQDRPSTELIGQYISEITDLLEENEPRVDVTAVNFLGTLSNGEINLEVVVEISV